MTCVSRCVPRGSATDPRSYVLAPSLPQLLEFLNVSFCPLSSSPECRTVGIRQEEALPDASSAGQTLSRFLHVFPRLVGSFRFSAEQRSIVWTDHGVRTRHLLKDSSAAPSSGNFE